MLSNFDSQLNKIGADDTLSEAPVCATSCLSSHGIQYPIKGPRKDHKITQINVFNLSHAIKL